MYRSVSVDARGDHLVVASNWTSQGKYPLFFLGDWAERAEEPASDEALGGLVREAFKACRVGVPVPDRRDNPEGEARGHGAQRPVPPHEVPELPSLESRPQ